MKTEVAFSVNHNKLHKLNHIIISNNNIMHFSIHKYNYHYILSWLLDPGHYLNLTFSDNHELRDYYYLGKSTRNKMYVIQKKYFPDFPNITKEEALVIKLVYDQDISFISIDENGILNYALLEEKIASILDHYYKETKSEPVLSWLLENNYR